MKQYRSTFCIFFFSFTHRIRFMGKIFSPLIRRFSSFGSHFSIESSVGTDKLISKLWIEVYIIWISCCCNTETWETTQIEMLLAKKTPSKIRIHKPKWFINDCHHNYSLVFVTILPIFVALVRPMLSMVNLHP